MVKQLAIIKNLNTFHLTLTQNKGKEMQKLLPKIEEISDGKAQTKSWKLIQNILTITDVFLDQKRLNVWQHDKYDITREFFKGAIRELREREGWGRNLKGQHQDCV